MDCVCKHHISSHQWICHPLWINLICALFPVRAPETDCSIPGGWCLLWRSICQEGATPSCADSQLARKLSVGFQRLGFCRSEWAHLERLSLSLRVLPCMVSSLWVSGHCTWSSGISLANWPSGLEAVKALCWHVWACIDECAWACVCKHACMLSGPQTSLNAQWSALPDVVQVMTY